ncbi:MAG: alpha/beta fold hydrolase [Alistipes inops]
MVKEEKFIMAGGCAVRVSDTLEGERTVVLLHGYLESLDVWDRFTELLAPQVRVVAADLPGHGISEVKGEVHTMEFMADTVHAAMETLGIGRAVVVGHSMGGYVALEMLRKYPEAFAGLVLFHSTPNPDSEKKREDRLREIHLIEGGKKELIARSFPHVGFAPQNRKRLTWAVEELSDQITLTEDARNRGRAGRYPRPARPERGR